MPMQVSIPGNETDLIFTIITHPLLSILSSLRPLLEVTDMGQKDGQTHRTRLTMGVWVSSVLLM